MRDSVIICQKSREGKRMKKQLKKELKTQDKQWQINETQNQVYQQTIASIDG